MNRFTYIVQNGLYINLTNRCSMNCTFCIRSVTKSVGDAPDLWLDREPTADEVIEDIARRPYRSYDEIVFCGFGEPTERLDELLAVCRGVKQLPDAPPVRINTNGLSSLVCGYDTAPLYKGLADTVSISLNAPSAEEYEVLCRPRHGKQAFYAMLDFGREVIKYVPHTIFTVVDIIGEDKIKQCQAICDRLGVPLRVRIQIKGE